MSDYVEELSLSLFSVSTCDMEDISDHSLFALSDNSFEDSFSDEPCEKKIKKSRFHLLRVKKATKCATKKCKGMFEKVKSKLSKPSPKDAVDVKIISSSAQMTYISENGDDFKKIDLKNEFPIYSPQSKILVGNRNDLDKLNSTASSFSFSTAQKSASEIEKSANDPNLIRQKLADSIEHLNTMFAHQANGASLVMPSEAKRFFDKSKMEQKSTPKRVAFEPFEIETDKNSCCAASLLHNGIKFEGISRKRWSQKPFIRKYWPIYKKNIIKFFADITTCI